MLLLKPCHPLRNYSLSWFKPKAPNGTVRLNDNAPSLAEALAVLAGHTLLADSHGTSFSSFPAPPGSLRQDISASVWSQQYSSEYSSYWECIFYAPLALAFVINVFCLYKLFFVPGSGFVTDFTEPETSSLLMLIVHLRSI